MWFGYPNDVPVTGDWDGSGKTQIGVWRPSNATWYLGDAGGFSKTSVAFGQTGDIPITGDWTGSGITQLGVYDPVHAAFYLREVPPAPPAPVVTVPVTTPVPTPPPGTRRHPRVRVTIRISWTYDHAHTRIHRVRMSRLPRGARVTVRCTGRGCPLTTRSAVAGHVGKLVTRLRGTTYRVGDRIFITITAPGRVAERAVVRIRNGRKPLAALL
jgi:hypothetical protein